MNAEDPKTQIESGPKPLSHQALYSTAILSGSRPETSIPTRPQPRRHACRTESSDGVFSLKAPWSWGFISPWDFTGLKGAGPFRFGLQGLRWKDVSPQASGFYTDPDPQLQTAEIGLFRRRPRATTVTCWASAGRCGLGLFEDGKNPFQHHGCVIQMR